MLTHTPTSPAWGPCITERAAIGNRANAAVAISIHADGGPSSGHGFASIAPLGTHPAHGLDCGDGRRRCAARGGDPGRVSAATGISPSTYLGSNGVYRSSYYGGLDWSHVPKVLLETANMRNPAEAARLEQAGVRQRIARGIALGLARFLAE